MSLSRSLLAALMLLAGFIPMVSAEPAEPLGYLEELPPLLDRDLFFGDPEISGAQLSPGRQVSSPLSVLTRGVRNIWIKGIDQPFDQAQPLTADDKPVPGYFWTQDGA